MKAFVEYGIDFDNNKFGLGRSVEIEYDDGSEIRTKEKVKLKIKDTTYDFGYNLLASPHEYSHTISANIKWDF